MKKSILIAVFVMVGVLFLTGCGKDDLSKYAGTYKLDYSKYVGDPETEKNQEEWTIELNKDGTGTSTRDGSSYTVEWSVKGKEVSLTEKFAGIKIEYNGTITTEKLDIFNGDKTNAITLEAIFIKQ